MWSWMQDNTSTVQVLVSLLSTVVWIAYLHVFLSSFRRQTRSSLLISRDGPPGLNGRCVVSNMGSEPAFLMDVLAEFETEDRRFTASVFDRQELSDGDGAKGEEASATGPMASGGCVDFGSFRDIIDRAQATLHSEDFTRGIYKVRLIAIAATSQARELVAASRRFEFVFDNDGEVVRVRPLEIAAEQIRSRRKRKKLARLLERIQRDEAMDEAVDDDIVADRGIFGNTNQPR